MLHTLSVGFVGLCFIVSVTFLLVQDPPINSQPLSQKISRAIPQNVSAHANATNQRHGNCYRNKLSNVLLVVIYNHPFYDSADLLRQFYASVFPNIYFCGQYENSTFGIHGSWINKGIYGYKCLADAIDKNPEYTGYFYLNDDVVLNYWNLFKFHFNFNKVGESSNQFGKMSTREAISQNWYWWISPYGFNNCKTAIEEIALLATRNSKIFKDMLDNFQYNGKDGEYCYNGRSDILYIPGHLARNFYEVSTVFYKHRVFLEIAIPTILRYIALKEDISTLHGMYLPGDVRKKDPRVTDSRYFWTTPDGNGGEYHFGFYLQKFGNRPTKKLVHQADQADLSTLGWTDDLKIKWIKSAFPAEVEELLFDANDEDFYGEEDESEEDEEAD
eukprot:gene11729-12949_t